MENMDTNKIEQLSLNLQTTQSNPSKDSVDKLTNDFADIFVNAAKTTFSSPECKHKNKYHTSTDKPWFGTHCRNARVIYNQAKKKYNVSKQATDANILKERSKEYKKIMNKYIAQHKSKTEKQLRQMHHKSPKRNTGK